ncbi:MAG: hypothetical protein IT340_02705 [Chloroflexi bacterium]|nr:hypothetical protein [Chloroflexota bacterium]
MADRIAVQPSRADRAVETAAAALLIVLYVVVVSRGEALPYADPARALTAPLLALVAGGLIAWRLRPWVAAGRQSRTARWIALALAGLALAAGLRLLVGPLDRSATPAEAAIVANALAIMRAEPTRAAEPVALALAWLHSPLAAYWYVAGVSAGEWTGIKFITVEATVPISRALHFGLGLATIVLAGLAARRLAGPLAGWLAGALLALSGPAIVAATTVDAGAPAGLLIAAVLLGLAARCGRVDTGHWPGFALVALALVGLVGLWLPGALGAALAPAGAVISALALAALGRAWWTRGEHAPAA